MSEAAHPILIKQSWVQALKALTIGIALIAGIHAGLYALTGLPIDTGFNRTGLRLDSQLDDGFLKVFGVFPGSGAEQAGIREGDRVRFDRALNAYRLHLPVGERVGMTVRTSTGQRHLILAIAPAKAPTMRVEAVLFSLAGILMALAGAIIGLRSLRLSGLVLGCALACMGQVGTYTYLWENHPSVQFALSTLYQLILSSAPILLLVFAVLMRREALGRPISLFWRVSTGVYAVAQTLLTLAAQAASLAFTTLPVIGDGFLAGIVLQWLGFALAFTVLLLGWREAVGAERTRFGFLFVALCLLFLSGSGLGFYINMTGNDFSLRNPAAVASHLCALGGIAAFLYASLRHKVVDLGFAVNRTLVYGVLSTVLLFAFWFFEWGLEEIIPAETREANILISAGIAFAIFLAFHHIRDWVEKAIEHLFFRAWRDNEARLKRFLREAAFVARPEALREAAVAEFARFGQGAAAALYEADADGMVLVAGGSPDLPERLPIDAPVLVRLRAEREALMDDPALPPGAAVALPTLYRNELTGVFLLSAKPGEAVWRPDEKALLADAALRIGLDLHALAVEALKAEKARESQRADILAAELRQALALQPAVA